jgi:hypothetical protein
MRSLLPVLLASVASFACSPKTPAEAEPDAAAKSPAGAAASEDTGQATELGEVEEDAYDPDDDVIEIEGPAAKREPNSVPIHAIDLSDTQVAWQRHATLDDPAIELLAVTSGVVGRSPAGIYTLEGETLVPQPDLTLTSDAVLLGHWPSEVWELSSSPVAADADGNPRYEYALRRLARGRTWVVEKVGGAERWTGEARAVRKGWHSGLLIRSGSSLVRVGSRKDPPKIGMRMGQQILDVIESNSGRLYNISLRPNGVYVQSACFAHSCVRDQAKKLPLTREWEFGAQIPRQRHSLSMLAKVTIDGVVSHQLLHYGIGGWTLETLVHPPTGIWPSAAGGLWLLSGDELRYRSSTGEWSKVAAPEGASKLSAAVSEDLKTLWIVAKVGSEATLWSTRADL